MATATCDTPPTWMSTGVGALMPTSWSPENARAVSCCIPAGRPMTPANVRSMEFSVSSCVTPSASTVTRVMSNVATAETSR